jgi:glucokinase
MKDIVVGIDVGGTNVKLGLVDPVGKVLSRSSFSTRKFAQTPDILVDAVAEAVRALLQGQSFTRERVAGVGIGVPGLVDVPAGIVRLLPNIPGWHNVPLGSVLGQKLGMTVQVENDVNMITLGEWKHGAGRGVNHLVCVTLGTGVGAGLVLDGRIYRGPGFAAGEIGHVPLDLNGPACGCGGWGCFERYVGHARLRENGMKVFSRQDVTLEEISLLAADHDPKALEFWRQTGERVAEGLIGTVNVLNPSLVIIGGGVARSLEFMQGSIEATIRRRCMKVQGEMVRFVKARLDDDAGIIGAEVLIRHENIKA